MWKLFFGICDFFCNFIPSKKKRKYIRKKYLFNWREKYRVLKAAFPDLKFRQVRISKGGWNIIFIVNKKYVFKIRKFRDNPLSEGKILRIKRITDALKKFSPLEIPEIEIVQTKEYLFCKYDFLPGKNLNAFSLKTIIKNRKKWGKQIAQFINAIHNSRPKEIADLRGESGDGWNHNDICNNTLVDEKTMNITGIVDWEYCGWGRLETEFNNCVAFSKKMKKANILPIIKYEYQKLRKK